MAIDVQSLDQIDQDQVDQALDFASQLILEKKPNLDTKRGVISELVLGLDAILNGAQRANISLENQSHSLLAIGANPDLADPTITDNVLSNYRISRQAATAAKGSITIHLSQNLAVTIPSGSIFEADGEQFTADTAFAARTNSANVLVSTDRLLTQVAANLYAFTIEVTAINAGADALITKDTKLVPLTPPAAFVTAFASADFTGGLSADTNQTLIDKLETGLAVRAWSNRTSIEALIKNASSAEFSSVTAAFAAIKSISIVGFGDPEMDRDQHWLFPMSGGGRADLYLHSQDLSQSSTLTKTATMIDKVTAGGIWQFSLARDDAPGLYEVTKILLTGTDPVETGFELTDDIRAADLTGDVYVPDIALAIESVYSRFQSTTIRFLDTQTAVTDADVNTKTQDYDITVKAMPLVKEVQEFLGERSVRAPAGDVLVKAAIPCFVSLSFTVQQRRTSATVDTDAIKTALAAYVNNESFAGKLYASALSRVVDLLLPDSTDASAIDMLGRIRRPDGTNVFLRSFELLTVPDDTDQFTSGRTTCFFLEKTDIAISVVNVDIPDV
jgi:hypothetical protein